MNMPPLLPKIDLQHDARDRSVPLADGAKVDAVVIGRNEGARLRACLMRLHGKVRRIIYVDSGSQDGSLDMARSCGAVGLRLDSSAPFSAARARNAGLAQILASPEPPAYVQFVDGDCIVAADWIPTAAAWLDSSPHCAVVAGRRAELHPDQSLYNRLCDWEWNTPIGPAHACGGDALIRLQAIAQIGGYRADVIAAEDDEMCQRLRKAGGEIWRIDAPMTAHDAQILRFSQWWRRAIRAGHGFAQVGALHPGHFAQQRLRLWIWGAVLPVLAVAGAFLSLWIPLAILALYALSFVRQARRFRRGGLAKRHALGCAALISVSKFPNLQGFLTWHARRLRGRATTLIEYK